MAGMQAISQSGNKVMMWQGVLAGKCQGKS
jgi:hypothetical protein